MLRHLPSRTLRFPMLNPKQPLYLFLLLQIKSSTGERNLAEWHAANLVLSMNGRSHPGKSMTNPERSQRPSTSLTLSSWRHYASYVVVQNSPASGFPGFSRVKLPWKLSFVVSSSPRSRARNFQEASSFVWHIMVFCRWPRMGLSVAFCAVGKKDAVRHFRKFHFGLADECTAWYVVYHALMYLSRFSN